MVRAGERIREFYEARLIHLVATGLPDIDRPGTLHDVFVIDYSCFVSSLAGEQAHALDDVHTPVPSAVAQVDPDTVTAHIYSLRGHRGGKRPVLNRGTARQRPVRFHESVRCH